MPLAKVHHHGALWWLREQELAVGATVALGTLTHVALTPLVAGGPIVAGCMLTPADGGTAVPACVTRWAGTGEIIYTVPAGTPIGTWGGGTVIYVVFTVSPREASLAPAQVGVAEVHTLGTWNTGEAQSYVGTQKFNHQSDTLIYTYHRCNDSLVLYCIS